MTSKGHQAEFTATMRRCLHCGAAADDEPLPDVCQECGGDFLRRPPRSYAEMEGIEDTILPPSPSAQAWSAWREQMLVERWIWFLFALGLLMVIAMMAFLA